MGLLNNRRHALHSTTGGLERAAHAVGGLAYSPSWPPLFSFLHHMSIHTILFLSLADAYFQYSIWLAFLLVIAALRLSAYFKRLAVAAAAAEQSPRNGNQRLSSPLLFQRVAASPPTAPAASDPAPHHTGAELLPRAGVSAATAFPRDGELQSQEEISHRLPSPEAQGQTERTGQQSVGRGGDVPALETQVQTAVGGERRGAHERSRSTSISLVPGMNLRGGRQGAVGGSVFRGSVSREFSHGTLLRMGYRLCVQRLRRRMRMIWEALGSRREQFLASRYHLYQEVCSAGGRRQEQAMLSGVHSFFCHSEKSIGRV